MKTVFTMPCFLWIDYAEKVIRIPRENYKKAQMLGTFEWRLLFEAHQALPEFRIIVLD